MIVDLDLQAGSSLGVPRLFRPELLLFSNRYRPAQCSKELGSYQRRYLLNMVNAMLKVVKAAAAFCFVLSLRLILLVAVAVAMFSERQRV